ncbi:hypothetical protein PIB30_066944 [Stylosanthes scabra]|uniref:Uncharacterized protein n=1 Tax=Stylosanthes scabra TaxID=79078 RepID=A0ABU6QMU1_9FABA|nr:hypothetical protein [Stylosanthes scabra]
MQKEPFCCKLNPQNQWLNCWEERKKKKMFELLKLTAEQVQKLKQKANLSRNPTADLKHIASSNGMLQICCRVSAHRLALKPNQPEELRQWLIFVTSYVSIREAVEIGGNEEFIRSQLEFVTQQETMDMIRTKYKEKEEHTRADVRFYGNPNIMLGSWIS